MGAVQFIENMDRTSLTISDEDFEKNVEAAVSAIAERNQALSPIIRQQATFDEKSPFPHGGGSSGREVGNPSTHHQRVSDNEADSSAPISGLLRTIQRPLTTIGRIFSDDTSSSSSPPLNAPIHQQPISEQALPLAQGGEEIRRTARQTSTSSRHALSAEEAAARQASAETAEAQRLQRAEHSDVVETLAGMFPDLDKDIISDVVYEKEGRYVDIL